LDYLAHMVARAEHERMVRSLPKVSDYDPVPEAKPRMRALLAGFRHKLQDWLVERITIINDFDARNHLRDLRREADHERLAQLVEAGEEAKKQKPAHQSRFTIISKMLAWMFAQTRRVGG